MVGANDNERPLADDEDQAQTTLTIAEQIFDDVQRLDEISSHDFLYAVDDTGMAWMMRNLGAAAASLASMGHDAQVGKWKEFEAMGVLVARDFEEWLSAPRVAAVLGKIVVGSEADRNIIEQLRPSFAARKKACAPFVALFPRVDLNFYFDLSELDGSKESSREDSIALVADHLRSNPQDGAVYSESLAQSGTLTVDEMIMSARNILWDTLWTLVPAEESQRVTRFALETDVPIPLVSMSVRRLRRFMDRAASLCLAPQTAETI